MAVLRTNLTKKRVVFLILLVIALVMPAVVENPRLLHALIMAGLAIVLATSNRLPFVGGTWHFGHIGFYAIGAYTVLLLVTKLGLSFWLSVPLAGVAAGVIGLGFAYATLRVRGVYFALLTLIFVEVVRLTITYVPFLGGYRVMSVPPPNPITIPYLFTIEFTTRLPYYYLIFGLVTITLIFLYRVEKSRIGAVLNAIAQSDYLTESIGINTARYKVLAFCIAAVFAGVAGAFYAPYVTVIGPSVFTLWASIVIWIYIVVGGMNSFWGPVVGVIFLVLLREYLPGTGAWENIFYGTTVVIALFFLPGGIVSLPRVVRQKVVALKLGRMQNKQGENRGNTSGQ